MNDLFNYLQEGEHECQDFKHSINSSEKIAISLCAFANGRGGRLLVGVKDNGTIRGCDPEEEKHMIIGAAQLFCHPTPILRFKVWKTTQGKVLKCNISEAETKPCFWKSGVEKIAFVRCADENIRASEVMSNYWQIEQMNSPLLWKGTKKAEFLLSFLYEVGEAEIPSIANECGLSIEDSIELLSELMYLGLVSESWDGFRYHYQLYDD